MPEDRTQRQPVARFMSTGPPVLNCGYMRFHPSSRSEIKYKIYRTSTTQKCIIIRVSKCSDKTVAVSCHLCNRRWQADLTKRRRTCKLHNSQSDITSTFRTVAMFTVPASHSWLQWPIIYRRQTLTWRNCSQYRHNAALHSTENVAWTKAAYLPKTYYYTVLQDHYVRGAKVCELLLLIVGN
jgi:hypothetical protein